MNDDSSYANPSKQLNLKCEKTSPMLEQVV